MIPVKLTISGFLSYHEPAELDFTGIHVACISGRNGAGKSAMLDAITWALFGEARKSDDSIINNMAEDNTAKVDFEFIYENTNYLVRRQKTKGKSVVVDFFVRGPDGESWKTLTEKRAGDTNKRICSTLHMDYKTFINASFFLQGKADQFTGQNAADRKKILSTILNLDVWEIYKARASEKRKLAESNASYLKGLIDEADAELRQEPALREALSAAETRAAEAEKAYKDADEKWQIAKANEASLKALKENAERKQQEEIKQERQIRDQQNVLSLRSRELTGLRSELANAETIEKNYRDLLSLRDRLDQLTAAAAAFGRLENERVRLEAMISGSEKQLRFEYSRLTQEKGEQERIRQELRSLEPLRANTAQTVETLTKTCAELPALREELTAISDEGNVYKGNIFHFEEKEREIREKLEQFLANQGGICPTCGREMDAEHCRIHSGELKNQIAGIRKEIDSNKAKREAMAMKYRGCSGRIKQLEAQEKELTARRVDLTKIEQQIKSYNERLGGWEEREKRLAVVEQLLQNNDFCPEERQRLQSINTEITELGYDRREHERLNAAKNALAGAENEHQKLIAAQSRIEPLEREISEKQTLLTESQEQLKRVQEERSQAEADYQNLRSLMPDLRQIENERIRTNQERDRANKELGQAEQRVKHLDDARESLKDRDAEYKEKLLEIRRYKDLEKAFGKDGIPALLIEQAIPEIEEQANEVLQQLSNGSMSLQFITQGSYKSKKDEVKETLDILIQDPYGVREYEMFSGGEAFRINFSIRLALSKILAQRAGSRLQTLVIDEGFGSQDDEGRARLAEAITAVRSDFEKILVITHLSELKEAFPSRIEVEKTADGSHIEVIP